MRLSKTKWESWKWWILICLSDACRLVHQLVDRTGSNTSQDASLGSPQNVGDSSGILRSPDRMSQQHCKTPSPSRLCEFSSHIKQYSSSSQLYGLLREPNQTMVDLCQTSDSIRRFPSTGRDFHWHKRYKWLCKVRLFSQQCHRFPVFLQRDHRDRIRGCWADIRSWISKFLVYEPPSVG
jgi:hypothetical protein